jgi:hypothetical protein
MGNRIACFALSAALTVSGCHPRLDSTPEQVEAEFSSALAPGDNADAIEAYFRKRGLEFSYDRFTNRYNAIIRHPESDYHAITIYVLLDPQKRFSGVEARDSYTSF